MNKLELVIKGREEKVVAYCCGKCGTVFPINGVDPVNYAEWCCGERPCKTCGKPTDMLYASECFSCRCISAKDAASNARAERYAKAKRVKITDPEAPDWLVWNGEFYDRDSLADAIACSYHLGGEVPDEVEGTYEDTLELDAGEILYSELERQNADEDAIDRVDIRSLQTAMDEWLKKQDVKWYGENDSLIVELTPEWIKANVDGYKEEDDAEAITVS